jgi:insulysin
VTLRELYVVDAEQKMNLRNDIWRLFRLQRCLSYELHPMHKFNTVSKKRLLQEAKAKKLDIPRELRRLFSTYYSANIMKLCVIAPYSLDLMQQWVTELFSRIPNKQIQDPALTYADQPQSSAKEMGQICRAVSLLDVIVLKMSWPIPPSTQTFRTKPANYVGYLLDRKGNGSLYSLLKHAGWAVSISASVDWVFDLKHSSVFILGMDLTDDGLKNIDAIISLVFSYLKMLKEVGVKRWFFEELAKKAETRFRFQERTNPLAYAELLSEQMSMFPKEHWITGPLLYSKYDSECISDTLCLLTPERLNVLVFAQHHRITMDRIEKYYGIEYHVAKYPKKTLAAWRRINGSLARRYGGSMPKRNKYTSRDFNIMQTADYSKQNVSSMMSYVSTGLELYHLPDAFFGPKASVRVKVVCPGVNACPENVSGTEVFFQSIRSRFEEKTADDALAEEASYYIERRPYGFEFGVTGFSDHIYSLTTEFLQEIASTRSGFSKLSGKTTGMIRNQIEAKYDRFQVDQPVDTAENLLHYLVYGSAKITKRDCLLCLTNGNLTARSDEEFAAALFSELRVVMLVYGNVTEAHAKRLAAKVSRTLIIDDVARAEPCNFRALKLPTAFASMIQLTKNDAEMDPNSALAVLFQIGQRGVTKMDATLRVTQRILHEEFFNEIRIRQGLAYLLAVRIHLHRGVQSLCFALQSPFVSPEELHARVEQFLVKFSTEILNRLSDEDFAAFPRYLVEEQEASFTSISQRVWQEIESGDFFFDRLKRERAAVKKVTKQDVITLFNKYISPNGRCRRKAVSLVYGFNFDIPSQSQLPPRTRLVTDVDAFRCTVPLFPATNCPN